MIDTSKLSSKEVVKIAKDYAEKNGITNIVIATTTGKTGVMAGDIFLSDKGDNEDKYNLVAVTCSTEFLKDGEQELLEENRKNGG
jgi:hypothetical protein